MRVSELLVLLVELAWYCLARPEEKGYSQTSTTVWWTPTTSYTSYASIYVGTSTSTVLLAVTQQPNVIVTLTSYIPCPVTSTVWVYVCNACNQPATVTQVTQVTQQTTHAVQIGTTTQTLYTTTTQGLQQLTRTYTSNGYVVVVVNPTNTGTTAAGQAAIVSNSSPKHIPRLLWVTSLAITATITLTTWL